MLHRTKYKNKIIFFNIFIIIFIYLISIFIKPNLIIKSEYVYKNIKFSNDLLFVYDLSEIKNFSDSNLFISFFSYLKENTNQINHENCPKKIISENFKDINVFNFKNNTFSVSINSKSDIDIINKCFNELFIRMFNDYYYFEINNKIEYLERQKNWLFFLDENNKESLNFDSNLFIITQKINFLKKIGPLMTSDPKLVPVYFKHNIDNIIFYLLIILLIFIFEIFFFLRKKFIFSIIKSKDI